MKLENSTLFVNTGRKPLAGMQKKKKTNKNNIALGVCIAIIAVLCIFAGLIFRVWFTYKDEQAPKQPANSVVDTQTSEEAAKQAEREAKEKAAAKKAEEEKKAAEEKKKQEEKAAKNKTSGESTDLSKAVDKLFAKVSGTYSYGLVTLSDNYTYINNTDKVSNSAALSAFLMEYASEMIYLGRFDYDTDVAGYSGDYLMTRAFSEGSVDAANLLIEHFGAEKMNAYFASEGYVSTVFGGTIGSGAECSTSSEDLIKLMRKMYANTGFFPYSDMYSKMRRSTVDDKIASSLPGGSSAVNMSLSTADETFDAAIVTTPNGSFIFVAMAGGAEDSVSTGNKAMADAAKKICSLLNE